MATRPRAGCTKLRAGGLLDHILSAVCCTTPAVRHAPTCARDLIRAGEFYSATILGFNVDTGKHKVGANCCHARAARLGPLHQIPELRRMWHVGMLQYGSALASVPAH